MNLILETLRKNTDTVATSLNRSLFAVPEIWADFGPFESLKAAGLQIISNESLRSFISQQFGQRLPGRIKEHDRTNEFFKSFDQMKPIWFTGEQGNVPWDFEELKNDKRFIHLVNFSKTRADDKITYYSRVIPDLDSISTLFDSEIRRLE